MQFKILIATINESLFVKITKSLNLSMKEVDFINKLSPMSQRQPQQLKQKRSQKFRFQKQVVCYNKCKMEPGPVKGQGISFLQCYICYQSVKKPRMCPSCSKLACQNCLRTWIEQRKPECPHCRKALLLGSFADCERFVNDIKHLLNSIDNTEKLKEKCNQHKIQMNYFCEQCSQPICPDCGMFGKHRGHAIIHLSRVYQDHKNRILNELAKFDNKIELFRKNSVLIKQELQRLHITANQKKNYIEEYFVSLIQRLDEEYRQKREKIQAKQDENLQQIQFLQKFRDDVCQELECRSQKQLIVKSEEYIKYIRSLCDREADLQQEDLPFYTIHQLVPNFHKFKYILKNYSQLSEAIIYSPPQVINGIQWRLKIYPRGNGVAKNTHLSVFLELSKGYQNHNKYNYKIQLVNFLSSKEAINRQYSSTYDIGECWGYNQFIPLADLYSGFLDPEDSLHFFVNLRNPSYRSLVKDQQKHIEILQNKLNSEDFPQAQKRTEKMNELVSQRKMQRSSFLAMSKSYEQEEREERELEEEVKVLQHLQNFRIQSQNFPQMGDQNK